MRAACVTWGGDGCREDGGGGAAAGTNNYHNATEAVYKYTADTPRNRDTADGHRGETLLYEE